MNIPFYVFSDTEAHREHERMVNAEIISEDSLTEEIGKSGFVSRIADAEPDQWLLYLISDDFTRKNRAFLFSKAAKTHISVLDKLHKLKAIGMQKQQNKPFHKLWFLSGITFIVFLSNH